MVQFSPSFLSSVVKSFVRIWFISVFLLLFTVQAIASVVELGAADTHDQKHHELESGHIEAQQQGQDHLHLCHHHHGEHTSKILPQAVSIAVIISEQSTPILFSAHYEKTFPQSLYRPPIS